MSDESTMSVLFSVADKAKQKEIYQWFESQIPEFKNSYYCEDADEVNIALSADYENDCIIIHFIGSYEGGDASYLFSFSEKDFKKEFGCNYYAIMYLEGDAVYVTAFHEGAYKEEMRFSPGRYKKQFWDILESENYIYEMKNWAIEKLSK